MRAHPVHPVATLRQVGPSLTATWIVLALAASALATPALATMPAPAAEIDFPDANGDWRTVAPDEVGWRQAAIDAALDYAGEQLSSHVVILHGGRLLAERVYEMAEPSDRYQRMLFERTDEGWPIEDVASVQKSVVSILAGIAEGKGLLELDAPVTRFLGEGWSKAAAEQEARITLRHLMTMTSGLDARGRFVAEPGTLWSYNTSVYSKIIPVLEKASGMEVEPLSSAWLTARIGMVDSGWRTRPWVGENVDANRLGFATTARDLARFGLLVLAGGNWDGVDVLGNPTYLARALDSTQELNPAYGLLWWLNGKHRSVRGEEGTSHDGPLIPGAPSDLVGALGALGRKVWVAQSLGLVVVRLGDAPGRDFDERFWTLLMAGAPGAAR